MNLKFKRGFTLIELLVVIAIIGLLSGIVIASLNTARNKGNNAAIKANMSGIRAAAEIIYDAESCYNDGIPASDCTITADTVATCATADIETESLFDNAGISAALLAAGTAADGTGLAATRCAQAANGGAWATSVPLKIAENGNTHWCVDSTGLSKGTTAHITTTTCP